MTIDKATEKFIERVTGMAFKDFKTAMAYKQELERKREAELNYTGRNAGNSVRNILSQINPIQPMEQPNEKA